MAFPLPQFIQLYPRVRCNQACTFCFNGTSCTVKDMSPEHALNLLAIMLEQSILDLDIMGGEPFLLPWMPSFLHAAINKGIMVNISTNGSFPDVIKEFRGLSPEKINIGISLEGRSAQTQNHLNNSAFPRRRSGHGEVVIELEEWVEGSEYTRTGQDHLWTKILGVQTPLA